MSGPGGRPYAPLVTFPLRSALAVSLFALAAGCASLRDGEPAGLRRDFVLIVGVDGLRPDQMALAAAPRLQGLAREGIAFVDATNTWRPNAPANGHSAPNWAALLTGCLPESTGLRTNAHLERPDDPQRRVDDTTSDSGAVRTLFWWVERDDPRATTAVFNSWWGIGMAPGSILGRSWAIVDRHVWPGEEGTGAERDARTVAAAAKDLRRQDHALTFVHIGQVDGAGHAHTYDSPEVRAAIATVDGLVGSLLDAIAARPERERERWLVVLTADHGGPDDGTAHGDNGDEATRRIPLVFYGEDLGAPVLGETGHLVDVAPTVLRWLGVEAPEGRFDGVPLLERRGG